MKFWWVQPKMSKTNPKHWIPSFSTFAIVVPKLPSTANSKCSFFNHMPYRLISAPRWVFHRHYFALYKFTYVITYFLSQTTRWWLWLYRLLCLHQHMITKRPKSAILGHIWPHCDLDHKPFDPKIWRIHPCPKVCYWWKFGPIRSTNTQDILLTKMFVQDMHARTHASTNTLET